MFLIQRLAGCRFLASVALLLMAFVSLPGCARFTVKNQPGRGEATAEPLSISVDVFQTQGAREKSKLRDDGVLTSLLYEKDGRWQVIGRSSKSRWTLEKLVPGRYRLEVAGVLDQEGKLIPIKGPQSRDFDLKDGQAAYADVVVKRTPTAVKVLIAVTIVLVIVLIILAIFDGDGDDMDIDVADVLAPIAAVPRFLMTYPEVWLDVLDTVRLLPPLYSPDGSNIPQGEDDEDLDPSAPQIEKYWPADQSKDVPKDATLRIDFDRPMSAWTLSPNTIFLSGSVSGEIVRGVEYREGEFQALIDPLRDFAPGETVTVTLYGDSMATDEGEALGENYRFSFQVANP